MQVAPPHVYVAPVPLVAYVPPPVQPVVSVYIEPPNFQPPPIVIGWAPPPMLVEPPPPMPFGGAVWVGGYWGWQGTWVWAAGRWAPPPQPGYGWVHPYYENRGGVVVIVTGHWSAPGLVFVPPPPSLSLNVAVTLSGVVPGPRPIGPVGVFVPAPPGSRAGLIVPAPIGTSPAVVIGAPPVTNVGMRIENRVENNTTINNTRVTNVTNITNVTIVAPAGATASGRAFESQVPAQAHLAAAQAPVVHVAAPTPASVKPIAAFAADRPLPALPPAQTVQTRPSGSFGAPAPHMEAAPAQRAEAVPAHAPAALPTATSVARPAEIERPVGSAAAGAPAGNRPTNALPAHPADAAIVASPPIRAQIAPPPPPRTAQQQAQADKQAKEAARREAEARMHAEAEKAKAAKEKSKNEEHEREKKAE